jgi:hypothetical protein
MLSIKEAQTLVRLSGGRVVPPVGSIVDLYQLMSDEGEPVALASGGKIEAIDQGQPTLTLVMRYGPVLQDFVLSPNDDGRPRFMVLPVGLPTPCPPPSVWPRWRTQ